MAKRSARSGLQLGQGSPAAAGGSRRAAAGLAVGTAPGATGRAAEENGFSLTDRLLATEQEIQLDELIKWLTGQAAVETRSESSRSPSDRGPDGR